MTGSTGPNGTLNGRGMSGRVRRSTMTPTLTSRNANSVPMLTSLTISLSGTSAARIAMSTPRPMVTFTGAPVRGLTSAKRRGIRPSRDIAKKIRVCP